MIRPVLYVDLPGIIYTLDRHARRQQRDYAHFVCWLEAAEHSSQPSIWRSIFPFAPAIRTWICEDQWKLLGFAQVHERPSQRVWDLSYLASMIRKEVSSKDVLDALLENTLAVASTHQVLRVFAKVEDGIPEIGLFSRCGFQRFARELTYIYNPEHRSLPPEPEITSLHRWNRHHVWGLFQLYRATTPQRVQIAELLENSEEYARQQIGSLPPFPSFFTLGNECFVCDVGTRLAACLRLYRGSGATPHRVWLIVHPEYTELAEPLLRFAIRRLLRANVGRIYCMVREYDASVITALRNSGFEQDLTKILLVRHLAALATRERTVPLLERQAVYGLKGLGTVTSRQKIMR